MSFTSSGDLWRKHTTRHQNCWSSNCKFTILQPNRKDMTTLKIDWRLVFMLYIASFINIRVVTTNSISCHPKTVSRIDNEPSKVTTAPNNVCITAACNQSASQILKDMDQGVDPCDDFYRFVCGNFIRNTQIPDDKKSVHTFGQLEDVVQEQIRQMIEEPVMFNEPDFVKLVKNFYKSCMNEESIERQGLKSLKQMMDALGGWPVVEGEDWNENNFNWIEAVYKYRDAGLPYDFFMTLTVFTDLVNATKRVIHIDQSWLGLDYEYIVKGMGDKTVKEYYKYMCKIAVLFGASKEDAEKQLKESLKFEIALANISLSSEKRRNITLLHNPMTIRELLRKFPGIPWREFISTVLAPVRIDDDEIVNIMSPSFTSNFGKLIRKTHPRIQANYAMWRIVMSSASYLNEEIRKLQLEFTSKLDGKTKKVPRWKECVIAVSDALSLSVGSLYIKKYFSEDARIDATEMIHDIRHQFNQTLWKVDWMDEVTRKRALMKAGSMSEHVGYPDELMNDQKVEEFYDGLEMSDDFYFENMLNFTVFDTESSFSKLREPVDKKDWREHGRAAVVNAFYSPLENSIQLPAGILQKRFFDKERPKYLNYGAIGFIVGHEITHGFDDVGRQFDQFGNLVEWWEPLTKERYLCKAECIIDQYSNYIDPQVGLNLNGINTQGENIADNGGIKTAYLAYKEWVSRNGEEPRLLGLNYSPEQMFWIGATSIWCSKDRPETRNATITTDTHSPEEFRVLGPFSNTIDFANDFKCPPKSRMNPEHKCVVW